MPLRERTPGEEGLREAGAPSTFRSPGSSASPGSPSALPRLRGWAGSSRRVRFPTSGLHHPGPDRLTPGVAAVDDSAPAQQGACPPRPVPARRASPPARASADSLSASRGTGVRSEPRGRLSERSLAPAYPHQRPWRASSTWTRAALWRSCSAAASKPSVSGTGGHTQPEPSLEPESCPCLRGQTPGPDPPSSPS